MRYLLLAIWCLVPATAAVYHYGPGQKQLVLDDTARLLAEGESLMAEERWQAAVGKFDTALELLPGERVAETRRVRVERAKAYMQVSKLPEAHAELTALVDNMKVDANAEPEVLAEAQTALANSQFYMTWLMRLEGLPREKWEPQIESARQNFRMLAEQSEESGDDACAQRNREDLEASIRLARMDLAELQGLPLPSQ